MDPTGFEEEGRGKKTSGPCYSFVRRGHEFSNQPQQRTVGVRPKQDVLQLRLFLVDLLDGAATFPPGVPLGDFVLGVHHVQF